MLFPPKRFVLCAGSKNVHMMLRTREDVDKYRDSRFMVRRIKIFLEF